MAHRIGQAMCYWLLPESGVPIARTSIQAISQDELKSDALRTQLRVYDLKIDDVLQNLTTTTPNSPIFKLYREDEEELNDNGIPVEPDSGNNTG